MKLDTWSYEASHGTKPRGRGRWGFTVHYTDGTTSEDRWESDRFGWRVEIHWIHFSEDEDGETSWEISGWREKVTLQQIENETDLERVVAQREAQARARLKAEADRDLVRSSEGHKRLAAAIAEAHGLDPRNVRATYDGKIVILPEAVADWTRRLDEKNTALANLGLPTERS